MERTGLEKDFSILFDVINDSKSKIDEFPTNNHQEQSSIGFLFQSFQSLLNNLIHQNKQLREEINQLKKQNQLQSERNAAFQFAINQLNEKNIEHRNEINRFNIDEQNSQLFKINQRHHLLEFNVKSIRKYLSGKYIELFFNVFIIIEI
jgi:chromosome segregation ATPase